DETITYVNSANALMKFKSVQNAPPSAGILTGQVFRAFRRTFRSPVLTQDRVWCASVVAVTTDVLQIAPGAVRVGPSTSRPRFSTDRCNRIAFHRSGKGSRRSIPNQPGCT